METSVDDPTPFPDVEHLRAEIESLRSELALMKQQEAEAGENARTEREKRHQLELVLAQAADGITVQNTRFELTFANKAAASLMGFSSPAELLATPVSLIMDRFEVLDEAGGPFPLERFPNRRALAGEASPQEIIRFRVRATGQERWSLFHSTPIYSGENQLYAIINFFQDVTALKSTEESLRVQREQYEVTLSSIGDAVIATDTAGKVSFMNGVASHLTGWDQEAALDQPLEEVFNIINEFNRLPVQNPVAKVLREGTVMGLANHTLLIARDGREIPIDDSAAPIRLGDGEIRGVVLVFRDVTERKQAEEREHFLSQASQFLASSLDYETTLQNVAGLAVPLLADWCTVHIVEEGWENKDSNATGNGQPQQVALAHKDPKKVEWVRKLQAELEVRYPYDPQAPTGLPKVLRSGQAELYADIPDELLVALVGPGDDYLLQLLRDFGFSSSMVVPLISRGRVLGAIQFTSTRESNRHYSEADLAFAQDLADRAAMAVDNARLYREAQSAIERLEELNQLKDRFLSIASHELRTPLTSLKGYAQILARQPIFKLDPGQGEGDVKSQVLALVDSGFNPQRVGPMLRNIVQQTDRMNKLIAEMTDVSRIRSGKLELRVLPNINLIELVRGVVEQQQMAHPDRTIQLVQVPEPAETLTGNYDDSRLEQVLHNFINNALKYSPADKSVQIGIEIGSGLTGAGTKEEVNFPLSQAFQLQNSPHEASASPLDGDGAVIVWVKDEGIGIVEEEQPFIFDSFFRARSGREHVADGLGLGLFISQQIVKMHGGQVGFESQVGKGSTFYFCLPLNIQ